MRDPARRALPVVVRPTPNSCVYVPTKREHVHRLCSAKLPLRSTSETDRTHIEVQRMVRCVGGEGRGGDGDEGE